MDNKYNLMVDIKTKNSDKPSGKDIAYINNRFTEVETSSKGFVEAIAQPNGRTYTNVFKAKRSQANVKGITFIALDFDNEQNDKELGNKIVNNRFTQQYATVVYETFSSTPEKPRYRLVFLLNRMVKDDEYKVIVNYIYNEYYYELEPDTHVIDTSRMFFGSKNTVAELPFINYTNELEVTLDILRYDKKLKIKSAPTKKGVKDVEKTPYQSDLASENPANLVLKQRTVVTYNEMQRAFRANDVDALKKMWTQKGVVSDMMPVNFQSLGFLDKLEVLNFNRLLGVEDDAETLQDVLAINQDDLDDNPSAELISNSDHTIYFSYRTGRNFNMSQILIKLGNFHNQLELIKFLELVTGIEWETKYQKDFSSFLRLYRQQLNDMLKPSDKASESSKKLSSKLNKLMTKHNLQSTLDAILDHAFTYAPSTPIAESYKYSIFATSSQLIKQIEINTGSQISAPTIKKHVNMLANLGFISKLEDSSIEPRLMQRLISNKKKFGFDKRSSLYTFSTDLASDVQNGLIRYDSSKHKSASNLVSYNLDEKLRNKITPQTMTNSVAFQRAEQKALLILLTLKSKKVMTKRELAELIYKLTLNFKSGKELTTKATTKLAESINKLDEMMKGVSIETATNEVKSKIMNELGVDISDVHSRTSVYFISSPLELNNEINRIESELNEGLKGEAIEISLKSQLQLI